MSRSVLSPAMLALSVSLQSRVLLISRSIQIPFRCFAPHSDVCNPNNPAYWHSRGFAERPEDWRERREHVYAQVETDGHLQAQANAAGSRPADQRRTDANRVSCIVDALKAALGSGTHVHKVGSQAKHTNVAKSDLDLWVTGTGDFGKASRKQVRDRINENLVCNGHTPARILLKETSIRVEYHRAPHIDIVFKDFGGKHHPKPAERFRSNPRARAAVRLIKASPQGRNLKGEAIEKAVIAAQAHEKNQSIQTIAVTAIILLVTKPQVKRFAAQLAGKELQLPSELPCFRG